MGYKVTIKVTYLKDVYDRHGDFAGKEVEREVIDSCVMSQHNSPPGRESIIEAFSLYGAIKYGDARMEVLSCEPY